MHAMQSKPRLELLHSQANHQHCTDPDRYGSAGLDLYGPKSCFEDGPVTVLDAVVEKTRGALEIFRRFSDRQHFEVVRNQARHQQCTIHRQTNSRSPPVAQEVPQHTQALCQSWPYC